jgi:hypothetical protein
VSYRQELSKACHIAGREYTLIEEDELLARLRDGDQAAFERLFLRHYGQMYRVLYHLVGSREEAEDLAQETFMALYNTRHFSVVIGRHCNRYNFPPA